MSTSRSTTTLYQVNTARVTTISTSRITTFNTSTVTVFVGNTSTTTVYLTNTTKSTSKSTQESRTTTFLTNTSKLTVFLTNTTINTTFLTNTSRTTTFLTNTSRNTTFLTNTGRLTEFLTNTSKITTFLTNTVRSTTTAYQANTYKNTTYLTNTSRTTTFLTNTVRSTTTAYQANTSTQTSNVTYFNTTYTTTFSTSGGGVSKPISGSSTVSDSTAACATFLPSQGWFTNLNSSGIPVTYSTVMYASSSLNSYYSAGWRGFGNNSLLATHAIKTNSAGTVTHLVTCSGGGGCPSDRRLKKNIKLIGVSKNGINIYSFEYKSSDIGSGVFKGVMADEVEHIKGAVTVDENGYKRVDYSVKEIDVKFDGI